MAGMKIAIQAAISVDGFVATIDGGTNWVKDLELYEQACREYGCIAMGRTTYDEYGGPAFDGVQQIVLSGRSHRSEYKNVYFVQSAEQALAKAKELGHDKLLVIGGSQTNGAFMRTGQVEKLLLDIHPIALGTGKKLFGDFTGEVQLRFFAMEQHQDFISTSYDLI